MIHGNSVLGDLAIGVRAMRTPMVMDILWTVQNEVGPIEIGRAGGTTVIVATGSDGRVTVIGDVDGPFSRFSDSGIDVDGFGVALYADRDAYLNGAEPIDTRSTDDATPAGLMTILKQLSPVRPIQ